MKNAEDARMLKSDLKARKLYLMKFNVFVRIPNAPISLQANNGDIARKRAGNVVGGCAMVERKNRSSGREAAKVFYPYSFVYIQEGG